MIILCILHLNMQFLLSDAEASIVRDLFHELLNNRGFFEPERYYFTPPDGINDTNQNKHDYYQVLTIR